MPWPSYILLHCSSTTIGLGHDELVFADKEVNHLGQIIGVVVAESQFLAQQAAKTVRVTYQDLPAIITIKVGGRRNVCKFVCHRHY